MKARLVVAFLVLTLGAAACSSSGAGGGNGGGTAPSKTGSQMQAIMATTDLYVGAPQRVGVGLPLNDGRLVSFGTVSFSFSFLGTSSAPTSGAAGPAVSARYIPTPGTPAGGSTVQITQPSAARGIYEADGVRFDRPGYWQVAVSADVPGSGTQHATAAFPVLQTPSLPAPGQKALKTDNLTMHSKGVPKAAIDSRAVTDGKIPDPELHRWTIAAALKQHRPIVVVFATPLYCQSQFCGPETDAVDALWRKYKDRAVFIHIEIWKDYNAQPQVINKAAADWLYRNGDLTEPWVYLIGSNGVILDRWSSLFDANELTHELQQLPKMH
ncbi:MAG: hypothetical protein ACXVPX_01105 [Actinomycetota bacterium]